MDALSQLPLSNEQQKILDSVLPGRKNWRKSLNAGGDCMASCPYFVSCNEAHGWGPDEICTTNWRASEPSPIALNVLLHVIDNFEHYNQNDYVVTDETRAELADMKLLVSKASASAQDDGFDEGAVKLRTHHYRERNSKAASKFKEDAANTGHLVCVACKIDFLSLYDKTLALRAVECHHTVPLASDDHSGKTMKKDLVLLCAICHRIAHSNKEVIPLPELSKMVRLPQAIEPARPPVT